MSCPVWLNIRIWRYKLQHLTCEWQGATRRDSAFARHQMLTTADILAEMPREEQHYSCSRADSQGRPCAVKSCIVRLCLHGCSE